jgi:hypothetical protein
MTGKNQVDLVLLPISEMLKSVLRTNDAKDKSRLRRNMTELSMYSKSQFYDLEVMCRERAAAARKEMEYWLVEAEEWSRCRLSRNHQQVSSSGLSQFTKLKS